MTVRKVEKKDPRTSVARDTIQSSPELQAVREMIKTLPTDEGEDMETAKNGEAKSKGPRKTKSGVKKVTKAAAATEKGTSLASICKSLKMEPRTARRILRNADGVPATGDRWLWTKDSDVAKVKKILQA